MIKSLSVSAAILLFAALIESAIFSNISFLPAVPDLVLLCVLYFSIQNGRFSGEVTGFMGGLFMDFLSPAPPGFNCLFRTILGYAGGLFAKTLNTEGVFIPMLLGLVASVLKNLLLWLIALLYPARVLSFTPLTLTVLFEIGINAVLTPFVFKFLRLFESSVNLKPEAVI